MGCRGSKATQVRSARARKFTQKAHEARSVLDDNDELMPPPYTHTIDHARARAIVEEEDRRAADLADSDALQANAVAAITETLAKLEQIPVRRGDTTYKYTRDQFVLSHAPAMLGLAVHNALLASPMPTTEIMAAPSEALALLQSIACGWAPEAGRRCLLYRGDASPIAWCEEYPIEAMHQHAAAHEAGAYKRKDRIARLYDESQLCNPATQHVTIGRYAQLIAPELGIPSCRADMNKILHLARKVLAMPGNFVLIKVGNGNYNEFDVMPAP